MGMPAHFNMSEYQLTAPDGETRCNTAACIAGTSVGLFDVGPHMGLPISKVAAIQLELDEDEAEHLFEPDRACYHTDYIMETPLTEITPDQAATVLRKVANGATPQEAWVDVGVLEHY